jgi:hypothetical protein
MDHRSVIHRNDRKQRASSTVDKTGFIGKAFTHNCNLLKIPFHLPITSPAKPAGVTVQ